MSEFFKKSKRSSEVTVLPSPLHSEHLKEGVRPIIAAILDEDNLGDSEKMIQKIKSKGDFVDYYGDPNELKKNNMLNDGYSTYIISDCSSSDKWSNGYRNCTGVAVIGRNRRTGEEISFISHQDPWHFLEGEASAKEFNRDLSTQLRKLHRQVESGTIDAVVFGGHYRRSKEHIDSIKTLARLCKEELGFEPVALTGPSLDTEYPTSVFLDTQRRRLFLVRPRQSIGDYNLSYMPENIDQQKQKWI